MIRRQPRTILIFIFRLEFSVRQDMACTTKARISATIHVIDGLDSSGSDESAVP